ncbi:MAG TPA: four helix bundle protein [Phycisphaerae bacterium]|nr:four helix bundle protein [Phycisphaerae bacterium]
MDEPLFTFEKLQVYQNARSFRIRIYKLARLLPKAEYKLKIQMWDAARSLTNNVAEGHGRYTFKDRKRFITDARASLQELVDDINLRRDESYAKPEHLCDLKMDGFALLKQLNGYSRFFEKEHNARKKKTTPKTEPTIDRT